jgi:hypothetical protein
MSVEMCLTFPIERQPNQAALSDVLVMLYRLVVARHRVWHIRGVRLISRDENGRGWRGFVTLKAGCKPSRRGLACVNMINSWF